MPRSGFRTGHGRRPHFALGGQAGRQSGRRQDQSHRLGQVATGTYDLIDYGAGQASGLGGLSLGMVTGLPAGYTATLLTTSAAVRVVHNGAGQSSSLNALIAGTVSAASTDQGRRRPSHLRGCADRRGRSACHAYFRRGDGMRGGTPAPHGRRARALGPALARRRHSGVAGNTCAGGGRSSLD